MSATDTVIERDLEIELILSPEHSVSVPARLTYRAADPYAVHVAFHIQSPNPVHWTFARELMVEGVFRPCGHGDVRIWPTRADGQSLICLALTSPDGDALLQAPLNAVYAWLERTLRIVPPGTEPTRLGIDTGLAHLLAPTPADDLWLRDPWPSDDSGPQDSAE
jgi:hypothetical protein